MLNFLIFLRKDFHAQKSTKRLQANKKKKMLLKTSKGEYSHLFAYLRFCAFAGVSLCRLVLLCF